MPRHIVNIADLEPQAVPLAFAPTGAAAGRYDPRVARIAPMLGAQKLG